MISGHFSIGSVGYVYLCFFLYIIKQDCSFATKGFLINYYHGQLRKASDNWSCKYTCNFSEVKQSLLFKISLTQTENWKMRSINLVSSRVITTCCCSNWKVICVTLRTEDLRSIYNCYSPHLLFSLVNRCLSSSALGFKDDVTRISIHLNLSSSSMTITYDVLVLEQQVFIILSLKK